MKSINKYLNNKLSEQELEQQTQDMLRAKFDSERKERWGQLLEEEHGVKRTNDQQGPGRRIWLWGACAIAASLLFLFLIRPVIEKQLRTAEIQLASNYIETDAFPNSLTRKGANEESEWRLQAAEAYNAQEYPAAIEWYEKLIAQADSQVEDHFFFAMSHLYQDHYQQAIAAFEQTLQKVDQSGRFLQETQWYLALAYIKNKQNEKGTALLQEILTKQSWHWEEAQKLLKVL